MHQPCQQLPRPIINWHPALGVKLAKRYTERRLLSTDLLQAIEGKIEAFADADSRGANEAKGMSFHCVR